jgi:hypothetical protein
MLLPLQCLHASKLVLVVVGRLKRTYWPADFHTRFCAIRTRGSGGIGACSLDINVYKHKNVICLLIFCSCGGHKRNTRRYCEICSVFLSICMVTMAVKLISKYCDRLSGCNSWSFLHYMSKVLISEFKSYFL